LLRVLRFYPEDGGSKFLRNVDNFPPDTNLHRQQSFRFLLSETAYTYRDKAIPTPVEYKQVRYLGEPVHGNKHNVQATSAQLDMQQTNWKRISKDNKYLG
jgi:hypothetical protein